jgi:hypothetical protein
MFDGIAQLVDERFYQGNIFGKSEMKASEVTAGSIVGLYSDYKA